jgi:hypothetical protein
MSLVAGIDYSTHATNGVTVWVWFDHAYYDGLMQFARGCYSGDGPVYWLGEELPEVGGTS